MFWSLICNWKHGQPLSNLRKKRKKQLKTNRQNKLQFRNEKMTITIGSTIRANKSKPLERKWLVFTHSSRRKLIDCQGKNSNFYDWIIWIAYRGGSQKKTKFEIENCTQCSSRQSSRISHFTDLTSYAKHCLIW
jgi:hypothetical protein